jgi:hypothetical protein
MGDIITLMKKINLRVPLIQVPKGSHHCQIGTTLMWLALYNDYVSYEQLVDLLKPYMLGGGMHSQGTVMFLVKKGYQTFFAHHDLGVLSPEIENLTEKDLTILESHLAKIEKTEQNAYRIKKLTLDIEYIKSGGKYSTKLPDLELVDEYLSKGLPVELGVRYKALHLFPTASNANHAVIVTGKDGDEYLINDPDPTKGEYLISHERLLHAWYTTGAQLKVVWR